MPFHFVTRNKTQVTRKSQKLSFVSHVTCHLSPAFTLIELLIVISIIGILVAAAAPSWQNAQAKSRDGKRKADARAIQQGLELYLQRNGQYPQASSGQIQCAILGDTHVVAWGGEFACTPSGGSKITYMQQLPKDPAYQDTTGYNYAGGNFAYTLSVKLENENDPDLGGLPCTPATSRNWCVTNP